MKPERYGNLMRAYAELMRELDKPTVGHPARENDLRELMRLVTRYPEETRKFLRTLRT